MNETSRYLVVAVEESDSSVAFYDSEDGEEIARIRTGRWPHEIALSHDRRRAYVTTARLVGLNLLMTMRGALGRLDQLLDPDGTVYRALPYGAVLFVLHGCSVSFINTFGTAGRPSRVDYVATALLFDMAIWAAWAVAISTGQASEEISS